MVSPKDTGEIFRYNNKKNVFILYCLRFALTLKMKSYLYNKEVNIMNIAKVQNQAVLSNQGDMTSFRYAGYNIRFRTPAILKKYVEVKTWENGYLVVMADYDGMGVTEEYIDLVPILQNLYITPETFLKDIKNVKIGDYEQ